MDPRAGEAPRATPRQTAAPQIRDPAAADPRTSNKRAARPRSYFPPAHACPSPIKETLASSRTEQAVSPDNPEYPPEKDRRKSHAALPRLSRAPSPHSSPLRKSHSNTVRVSAPSRAATLPPQPAFPANSPAPYAAPRRYLSRCSKRARPSAEQQHPAPPTHSSSVSPPTRGPQFHRAMIRPTRLFRAYRKKSRTPIETHQSPH